MHIYKEECRHAPEIGICTGALAMPGAGWRGRVRAWQDRGLAVRLPHSALKKSGTALRASDLNTLLTYFSFRAAPLDARSSLPRPVFVLGKRVWRIPARTLSHAQSSNGTANVPLVRRVLASNN